MYLVVPSIEPVPGTNPLADVLSNSLVLQQTAPYLPVSSTFALGATSKSLRHIVYNHPEVFHYLDLSTLSQRSIVAHHRRSSLTPDSTEADIESASLRHIFKIFEQRNVLRHVRTLVLDGLSVPAELVQQIFAEDRFNIRILSIRGCANLNSKQLMQVLRYAVRPGRPDGTPSIKGIYYFGSRDSAVSNTLREGTLAYRQRVSSSNEFSTALARTSDPWYQCSGRMIAKQPSQEWAEILQACEGIIALDAVLCRGPRHDPAKYDSSNPGSYLNPAIATVALGPAGCDTCHSSPEGPARFGHSPASQLPLLSPVPLHTSTIRAAQMPHTIHGSTPPPLFARCVDCLKGRWCERCHKWWDEDCYTASTIAQRTELQEIEFVECTNSEGGKHMICKETRKVIGVRRDCFGCGHTCISCKEITIRKCDKCHNEYCLEDNDSSSATRCDWCNYTSRRTVELY